MDISQGTGQLIMFVSGWLAKQENVMRKENQIASIAKGKLQGKYKGRSSKIFEHLYNKIKQKRNAGLTIAEIVKKFKIEKIYLL